MPFLNVAFWRMVFCGYAVWTAPTTSSSHFRAKGEGFARRAALVACQRLLPTWWITLYGRFRCDRGFFRSPIPLRLLLAAQPELITPVLQVVQRVLSRHLLEQAGLKAGEGDCGSVTLIHRFSSDITCKQVSLLCNFVVAQPPT